MSQPSEKRAAVHSAAALRAVLTSMRGGNGEHDLLPGPPTRVALLHECNRPAPFAEVHANADDIFHVLEGSAVITLGGALIDQVEASEGEWRGTNIEGGQTLEVHAGDVITIPRGVPHSRHTENREVSLLLVKVTGG